MVDFFSIFRLCVVVVFVSALPGSASEMPFSADYVISGDFDGASSVITVDMDCDGDLDVAASSRWAGTVNWWENPGGALHTVATGFTEAYDLAVGDFNGDGLPDLAGAARGASGSNVRWWANPGPGIPGLWAETNVSSALLTQALSVAAGDIDGDGYDDIVAAGYHSSVAGVFMWFRNGNGDGASFDFYDIGTGYDTPHSVDLGDVDGDLMIDLMGTTLGGDQVLWFRNDGSIISSDLWPVEVIRNGVDGAICVRGADIDGDGDLDLAVAAFEAGDLLWYENSGATTPTWNQHLVESSFAGVYSVEPVDLDHDGDLDLLASARTDDAVRWWEQSGISWYEHSIDDAFDGARSAVAADLDLDGDLDVVAAADEADDVTWWENKNVHRDASFTTKTTVTTGTGEYTGVGTLDFDGDGKIDIVAVSSNDDASGDVKLFVQGATWTSWTTVEIDADLSGVTSLRVSDLNGDSFEDLLVAVAGDDEIVSYWNSGNGSFFPGTIATGFVGASDAEAGDIDGDGDMDVVGVAETAGLLRWWEHDFGGPTPWVEHNFAPLPGASAVAIGDLDGDFDPDVVAVSASEGKLIWYENLGPSGPNWMWTPHTLTTGMSAPRSVVIGDFSGDGRMDIAAAGSTGEPEVWLWINQGSTPPTWSLTTHSGPWDATSGLSSLATVDIDLDGDPDLMGVLFADQRVGVWINPDGAYPSWGWEDIAFFDGMMAPLAVGSGDIDGDGDPDAVVVGNDDVTLVRNQGGQFSVSAWAEPDIQVGDGEMTVLIEIAPNHLGRTEDLALELEWLNLGFEREDGTPISEAEINALVERLYLFHDSNANGVLEIGVDPLLAVEDTIEMVSPGYVQLPIPHGPVNPPIIPGQREYFFVIAEMTDDASAASPSCFRTVHMAGGSVTALRYDLYDIDPKPAWFASVEGGLVCAGGSGIFADGFEGGDTSAWSITQ